MIFPLVNVSFSPKYSPECDSNLPADNTGPVVLFPNFPNGYASGLDCRWLIEADPGKTIKLQFSNIDLESHISCLYDYIEVFDGKELIYNVVLSPHNLLYVMGCEGGGQSSDG